MKEMCVHPFLVFATALSLIVAGCSDDSGDRGSSGNKATILDVRILAPGKASSGVPLTLGLEIRPAAQGTFTFAFGDGERQTTSSLFVTHVYENAGTYTLTVDCRIQGSYGTVSRTLAVVDGPGPQALFELPARGSPPVFGKTPFPCELYRSPEGALQVEGIPTQNRALLNAIEQGLSTVDGFGTNAAGYFWFGQGIDRTGLPEDPSAYARPGSPVFLINIDPRSPSYRKRTPLWCSWNEEERRLGVMPFPGCPLEEHVPYALVLTSFLCGPTGSVAPSADFEQLRDRPSADVPEHVMRLYSQLWDTLAGEPDTQTRASIPCAVVFTTQSISRALVPIREELDRTDTELPAPAPVFDEHDAYGDDFPPDRSLDRLIGEQPLPGPGQDPPAHDQIRAVITRATYTSPDYLSPDPDFFDPYGGQFVFRNGRPVPQGEKRLPFTLVLPRSPEPPEGYPLVMVQHGLGLARLFEPIQQANELARNGFAVISIDAVQHGDRYDVSNISLPVRYLLHELLAQAGISFPMEVEDRLFNYTNTSGPDGWADPNHDGAQLAFTKGFFNLAGIRDNVLQTVVDQMQLVRMIRSGPLDVPGIGPVRFRSDRIFYVGNSLGAWVGSIFISVEPRVAAGLLNCGGGGIVINLIVNSPAFGGQFAPLLKLLFDLKDADISSEFSPLLNLVQVIVEGLDPLNWASHSTRQPFRFDFGTAPFKNVLLMEAMWDNSMPNQATEALARAFGVTLLKPFYREVPLLATGGARIEGNVGQGAATAALSQYGPAEHGYSIGFRDGHIYFELGFPFEQPPRFRPVTAPDGKYPIRDPVEPGVEQLVDFLLTTLNQGRGTVEMKAGYAPVHDYDDDGYEDSQEIRAGTDPSNPYDHP